jgi:hypothetical protein
MVRGAGSRVHACWQHEGWGGSVCGGSACNKRKRHLEVSMNSRLFLAEANKLLPFDSLCGSGREMTIGSEVSCHHCSPCHAWASVCGGTACNKRKHHLEVSMNSRLFLVEANKLLPFDSLCNGKSSLAASRSIRQQLWLADMRVNAIGLWWLICKQQASS